MNSGSYIQTVLDTFRRINIKHVYLCTTCSMCWLAKDLYRTRDGKYVCLKCNHDVQDVTDSPLGQEFFNIVGRTQ